MFEERRHADVVPRSRGVARSTATQFPFSYFRCYEQQYKENKYGALKNIRNM